MSKRRRVNPSNKFVMIERWLWRCPAWQALDLARSLYIELEMLYCGTDNGEIPLGVRKATELLGCSFNHARENVLGAGSQRLHPGVAARLLRIGKPDADNLNSHPPQISGPAAAPTSSLAKTEHEVTT